MKRPWTVKPDPELEIALAQTEDPQERDALERVIDEDLRRRLMGTLSDIGALLHRGGGVVHIATEIDKSTPDFRRVAYHVEYNSLLPKVEPKAEDNGVAPDPEPVEA